MKMTWTLAYAVTALSVSSAFAAPTAAECIDANRQAQVLRREGKLRRARAELGVCGAPSCPAVVRADCAERMEALEHILPSVVFEVTDTHGNDLVDVRITADGEVLATKLDGTALPVDVGSHLFRFEQGGFPVVIKELLIREGDTGRRERIVLAPTSDGSLSLSKGAPPYWSTPRIAGATFIGAGVVAASVATVMGLLASSSWSSSKSECSSAVSCGDHDAAVRDHDAAVTEGWASTIAIGIGAASLVTGFVLFLAAPRAATTRDRPAKIVLRPSRLGVSVAFSFL